MAASCSARRVEVRAGVCVAWEVHAAASQPSLGAPAGVAAPGGSRPDRHTPTPRSSFFPAADGYLDSPQKQERVFQAVEAALSSPSA